MQPYMRQGEDDTDQLHLLGDRLHTLPIDTAARIAKDEGESSYLVEALNNVTTGYRRLWNAVHGLTSRFGR